MFLVLFLRFSLLKTRERLGVFGAPSDKVTNTLVCQH